MGPGRLTSAISAGLLALALGGGIWLMAPAPASAASPGGACGGQGLLSGVAEGLCKVVGGVADTVSGVGAAMGGGVDTAGKAAGKAAGNATGGIAGDAVGNAVGKAGETASRTVEDAAGRAAETVSSTPSAVASVAASAGIGDRNRGGDGGSCSAASGGCGRGRGAGDRAEAGGDGRSGTGDARRPGAGEEKSGEEPPGQKAIPGGTAGRRRGDAGPILAAPQRSAGDDRDASAEKKGPAPSPFAEPRHADVDKADPQLLWPGPSVPPLKQTGRGQAFQPHKPYDDVLGTTLTAMLLLSAVLAARVFSTRRARHERHATIPLEPTGARNRHHRLA